MPDQLKKIWLLDGDGEDGCGVGVSAHCVVSASTEGEARQLANSAFSERVDYSKNTKWFALANCQELGVSHDANSRVILFHYSG
jgi:hypothetical protein